MCFMCCLIFLLKMSMLLVLAMQKLEKCLSFLLICSCRHRSSPKVQNSNSWHEAVFPIVSDVYPFSIWNAHIRFLHLPFVSAEPCLVHSLQDRLATWRPEAWHILFLVLSYWRRGDQPRSTATYCGHPRESRLNFAKPAKRAKKVYESQKNLGEKRLLDFGSKIPRPCPNWKMVHVTLPCPFAGRLQLHFEKHHSLRFSSLRWQQSWSTRTMDIEDCLKTSYNHAYDLGLPRWLVVYLECGRDASCAKNSSHPTCFPFQVILLLFILDCSPSQGSDSGTYPSKLLPSQVTQTLTNFHLWPVRPPAIQPYG